MGVRGWVSEGGGGYGFGCKGEVCVCQDSEPVIKELRLHVCISLCE